MIFKFSLRLKGVYDTKSCYRNRRCDDDQAHIGLFRVVKSDDSVSNERAPPFCWNQFLDVGGVEEISRNKEIYFISMCRLGVPLRIQMTRSASG